MRNQKQVIRSVITIPRVVLFLTSFSTPQFAEGRLQSCNQTQPETITGENRKNGPAMKKILLEIEYSKKQIVQLQKNQKNEKLAGPNVQNNFNEKGMSPDDYIKISSSTYSHA